MDAPNDTAMLTDEFTSDLADRFVIRNAGLWSGRGLPPGPLASACAAWGLAVAIEESSAEEVARGLERMAAEIRSEARPKLRLI